MDQLLSGFEGTGIFDSLKDNSSPMYRLITSPLFTTLQMSHHINKKNNLSKVHTSTLDDKKAYKATAGQVPNA